jgi:nicotinamidase-related amidase
MPWSLFHMAGRQRLSAAESQRPVSSGMSADVSRSAPVTSGPYDHVPGAVLLSGETAAKVHDWRIEDREYARHEARRGRRHAFEHLEPSRTALVVIDMVPFFVAEGPYCRGIVPNISRLAASLRRAGGTVAWVLPGAGEPSAVADEFFGPDIAEMFRCSGGEGSLRDRLWHEFEVHADDLLVEKTAPSAFFPGRSPLPELLRLREINSVLVTGIVTNVCCESSARDASTLGYRVIMVADANAARRDQDHNASLHTIYRTFGDVRATAEVLALIEPAGLPARGDADCRAGG